MELGHELDKPVVVKDVYVYTDLASDSGVMKFYTDADWGSVNSKDPNDCK